MSYSAVREVKLAVIYHYRMLHIIQYYYTVCTALILYIQKPSLIIIIIIMSCNSFVVLGHIVIIIYHMPNQIEYDLYVCRCASSGIIYKSIIHTHKQVIYTSQIFVNACCQYIFLSWYLDHMLVMGHGISVFET